MTVPNYFQIPSYTTKLWPGHDSETHTHGQGKLYILWRRHKTTEAVAIFQKMTLNMISVDGWMEDLHVYVLFNNILVQWKPAVKISPRAGLEPGTL